MNKKGKKRKIRIKKARILALLCIIVLAIIFVFRCANGNKENLSKAMKTVSTYMSYINEQKYEEMYELLDISSKKKVTKEEFVQRNKEIYESLEATSITVSDMKEEELENRQDQSNVYK